MVNLCIKINAFMHTTMAVNWGDLDIIYFRFWRISVENICGRGLQVVVELLQVVVLP